MGPGNEASILTVVTSGDFCLMEAACSLTVSCPLEAGWLGRWVTNFFTHSSAACHKFSVVAMVTSPLPVVCTCAMARTPDFALHLNVVELVSKWWKNLDYHL